VWVLEPEGEFDYSPAKVFGDEIRPIIGGKLSPNADATWHHRAIQQLRQAFVDYVPSVDFVIPTGRPVRMMLAAMVMRERGERHKLLGWDNKTRRYLMYDLDLRLGAPDRFPITYARIHKV
jgi:hypothetical protein